MQVTLENLIKCLKRMDMYYVASDTFVTVPLRIKHMNSADKMEYVSHISVVLKPISTGLWMWVTAMGYDKEGHGKLYVVHDAALVRALGVLADMANSDSPRYKIRLVDASQMHEEDQPGSMLPETDVNIGMKAELQEGEFVKLLAAMFEAVGSLWSCFDDKVERLLNGNMADIESVMSKTDVAAVEKFVRENPDEILKLRDPDYKRKEAPVQSDGTSADPDVEVTIRVSQQ